MTACANCGRSVRGAAAPAWCARCRAAVALLLEALGAEIVAGIYEGMAAEIRDGAPPVIRLASRGAKGVGSG